MKSAEELVGIGAEADARAGRDIAAEQHQIGARFGGEKVGDREAVGDHLKRPANEQAGHLVGGRAAIEEHGFPVFDHRGRGCCDRTLGSPVGRLPLVKLGQPRHAARVEHAAMGASG